MADELRVLRERAAREEAGRLTAVARAETLEERARQAEKQSRDLRVHLDRLAERLKLAGEAEEPLLDELRDAKAELEQARQQAQSATASSQQAAAQLADLQTRADSAEQERDALRSEHQALTEKSTFYEQAAKEAATSLAAASAAQSEAERQLAELQASSDARHEEFRQERNRLSRENERLEKRVDQLETELADARSGLGGSLRKLFRG